MVRVDYPAHVATDQAAELGYAPLWPYGLVSWPVHSNFKLDLKNSDTGQHKAKPLCPSSRVGNVETFPYPSNLTLKELQLYGSMLSLKQFQC